MVSQDENTAPRISIENSNLKLQVLSGAWPQNDNPTWLSKIAKLSLTPVDQPVARPVSLTLELASGPDSLYTYFPFCTYIYIDDKVDGILEFSGPDETCRCSLILDPAKRSTVTFVSELSAVPAEKNISPDLRDLAVILVKVRAEEAAGLGEETPDLVLPDYGHFLNNISPVTDELSRPIFVVGMYRSGTSISTWAIGQHPNIWPLEETGWLTPLSYGTISSYRFAKPARHGFINEYEVTEDEYLISFGESINHFIQTICRRQANRVLLKRTSGKDDKFNPHFHMFRSLANPKKRWVDGTPENIYNVFLLLKLWPRAKFIFLVRDPADVVTSMMNFHRIGGSSVSAASAMELWIKMTELGLLAERAFGSSVVKRVLFGDLRSDPESALRDIFKFLGEPYYNKSIEVFSVRINSSMVSEADRQRTLKEIGREQALREKTLALYETATALPLPPGQTDPAAMRILDEMSGHTIAQIIGLFTD